MEHGILRISETATTEIEAVQAIVIINVTNEKIVFGNAAIAIIYLTLGKLFLVNLAFMKNQL
mgnify:CR=1 FL=1